MSVGRFDRELELPSRGDIAVKGPFDPEDAEVGTAKVLFLIVQGEGENTVVVDGEGTWRRGENDDKWTGTASREGNRAGGGTGELYADGARGIALSVVMKPGKLFDGGSKFDPPSIEALTWCADFRLVGSPGQAA